MSAASRIPLRRPTNWTKFEPDLDWKALAKIFGRRELSAEVREHIVIGCKAYAWAGGLLDPANCEKAKDLRDAIVHWQKETRKLCRILRTNYTIEADEPTKLSTHFVNIRKTRPSRMPTEFFSTILPLCYSAAEMTKNKVSNFNTGIEARLWDAWVAYIGQTLCVDGIEITVGSTYMRTNDSPFVVFIKELQKKLPKSCERRRGSDSIVAGIKRARAWMESVDRQRLLLILIGHGQQFVPGAKNLLENTTSAKDLDVKLGEIIASMAPTGKSSA